MTKNNQFSVSRDIRPMTITTLPSLHLDPTSPHLPFLTPLHQIVVLPQINKHYQRVTDYGLAEAASVCYNSGRSVSITGWARRPRRNPSIPASFTGAHVAPPASISTIIQDESAKEQSVSTVKRQEIPEVFKSNPKYENALFGPAVHRQ